MSTRGIEQPEFSQGLRRLLETIGEDPTREGLVRTPERVAKALVEMTTGYSEDPKSVLGTVFSERSDEMILLKNIPFISLCEHHLMPFMGVAHVAYLPRDRVVGLSKLARLVSVLSRRLQIQERLTNEIAGYISEGLDALGVGVVIRSTHCCMVCRGIKSTGSEMVTSCLLGSFKQQETRQEFLSLIGKDI